MGAIAEIEKDNLIKRKEFKQITELVFESFLVDVHTNNKVLRVKQGDLIEFFTKFLNRYLELQFVSDNKIKLEVINFIDKLNLQHELIELDKGITKTDDIKASAQRLGKKAQSSFKTK